MTSEMEATEYLVMNKNDEIKKLNAELASLRSCDTVVIASLALILSKH